MKKLSIVFPFLLFFLVTTGSAFSQSLTVYDLTCNHKLNPIGIPVETPKVSWKLKGSDRNILQTAYSVRVATSNNFSGNSVMLTTPKTPTDQSVLVPLNSLQLKPATRYYWQVKVWDNLKHESKWSETAFFETGLGENNWNAQWVYPQQDTSMLIPAVMLRKEFGLNKAIAAARVYITSLGNYELSLNGQRVGDEVLTPGWTSYGKRLQYQVYDITSQVKSGNNAIGVMVGNGWYHSNLGWQAQWGMWGKKLGLLCQVLLRYTDGTEEVFGTDNTWRSYNGGPVVMTGIYEGETYDAQREVEGWNKTGFDDSKWTNVNPGAAPSAKLVSTETVPVKRIQEIKPVKFLRTPKGSLVADFGQNLVGWVRLSVSGNKGSEITIRHAEVLDKEGEFYTENLRAAKATMKYILKGQGVEVYEPKFTFFGFRYIEIDGISFEPKPENFTAVVVHSDMKPTGNFECSNPLVNQLQKNIQWGQKGNFVDVPTDCPQRDERLGWTGDAQVFARTAAYNMDVAGFFTKWLKDLAADQGPDGAVPPVIPNVLKGMGTLGSAGWADASTIIPWEMYQVYGDKDFLENQYESMKAWIGYIESKSQNNLWNTTWHFGDWLFYRPGDDNDGRSAVTDKHLISQCFWAHSTQLVINAAQVLGKTDDVRKYTDKLKVIKDAFLKEYVTPSGRLVSSTQTAYVLALNFDMLPENLRAAAADRLVANIKDYNNHLTTGFLGTPYLCHVLSRFGYHDVAYTLLLQESYPSWLYPVKMGATTIWERWDGQKPDSTFQTPGMNSFNHYAYGAIGDWMYRRVAGIELGSPGYKQIIIQPQPDQRLTYAKGSLESPHGLIQSGWEKKGNVVSYTISIPANTTATIKLPKATTQTLSEGKQLVTSGKSFKNVKQENDGVSLEVGSGTYNFQYPMN